MANEFTGKSGAVLIGTGTNQGRLDVTSWQVVETPEEFRTDNTGSGNAADRIAGIADCVFTIEANHDKTHNIFEEVPVVKAGDVLTDVKLFYQGTSGACWHFPSSLCTGMTVNSEVRGLTRMTITGACKGAFNRPTGASLAT